MISLCLDFDYYMYVKTTRIQLRKKYLSTRILFLIVYFIVLILYMNTLMFLTRFAFRKWNKMVSFSMNWIFVCGRTLFLFEIMLTSHTGLKDDANLMS